MILILNALNLQVVLFCYRRLNRFFIFSIEIIVLLEKVANWTSWDDFALFFYLSSLIIIICIFLTLVFTQMHFTIHFFKNNTKQKYFYRIMKGKRCLIFYYKISVLANLVQLWFQIASGMHQNGNFRFKNKTAVIRNLNICFIYHLFSYFIMM